MSKAVSVSVGGTKVVTEYYFSRWVSLAFSILLSAASGSGYAFGIWSNVLKGPPLNLSADDVSLNASISNLGLYLGVINGMLYGRVGPRITIIIGVMLVAFGFICNYLLLSGIAFPASLPLLCFFSFVAQFGSSCLQTAAISTGVRNFPALSRGQIGGLVKGTFALASSILGEYYLALFSTNTLNYLLFVAIYVPVMSLVCMPFINLIPRETVERYQEENERSQITLHAKLFDQVGAEEKEIDKEADKNAETKAAAAKDVHQGDNKTEQEDEKSKSWKELAGGRGAVVEMATLSQTVAESDTNPTAILVGQPSEGTVSVKFNDGEREQQAKKNSLVESDVPAVVAPVKAKAVTLKVEVPKRRPLNLFYRILSKLSPSGRLNPQSMLYGYLFLAFGLGVYVSIVAAIQAKETVSQGLRIGGFVLTDIIAVSFIVIGASFGDFRIKFQRTVPANYGEGEAKPNRLQRFVTWLGGYRGGGHGHGHGHGGVDESQTLWSALHTGNFYLMMVAQFCTAGSGLVLINNMSDIAKAYAASDYTASANDPSLLVVIVGFGSFLGRVFCGFISDRFIRYISRPMYHSAASFLSAFCFALLSGSIAYNALYPVALLEGFAYGVAFSTMTTMVADLYGPTHHAAIYGAVDLGPCGGSLFFAYFIKNRFYIQGTNVPSSQMAKLGNYCFGYTCFQNTFIICCCVTLLASALTFIVAIRTKKDYAKLVSRLESMRRTLQERNKQQHQLILQQQELEEEDAKKRQNLDAEESNEQNAENVLASPSAAFSAATSALTARVVPAVERLSVSALDADNVAVVTIHTVKEQHTQQAMHLAEGETAQVSAH